MSTPALLKLLGFPDAIGSHQISVVDHAGPSSYTVISTSTPPAPVTGGDTLYASEFGFKYLIAAICVGSNDGVNDGLAFIIAGQPVTSCALGWYTAHTGAEVASGNLSGKTMKIIGIGL